MYGMFIYMHTICYINKNAQDLLQSEKWSPFYSLFSLDFFLEYMGYSCAIVESNFSNLISCFPPFSYHSCHFFNSMNSFSLYLYLIQHSHTHTRHFHLRISSAQKEYFNELSSFQFPPLFVTIYDTTELDIRGIMTRTTTKKKKA